MGKIIRALFEVVIPGQDFIYLPHLKGLIYFAKTRKPFIPSPVRKIEDKYVMLDGHTRAIYRKMSWESEYDFYLAEDKFDVMPDHFFGKVPKKVIDYDYGTMSHMWDLAESYSRSIDFRSINVFFEALVTNAPYLKSLEECIMFMELNPNLFEMNRSVDSFICPSF